MSPLQIKHVTPAVRTFAGTRALESLESELKRAGCRRTVVVCSPSMLRHRAVLDKVEAAIGNSLVARFDGVRQHSPTVIVEQARVVLSDTGADSVVAVGGGSAVVTARAATILLAEKRGIHELCTRRGDDGAMISPRLGAPKLPQWIVPSTPSTACAKAGSAVQDSHSGERLTMFDPKSRAQGIIVDPDVVLTSPVALVNSATSSVLSMAVAGLLSGVDNPLASSLLEGALRLLNEWWPKLRSEPANPDLRMRLVLAAILTGQGSDHTGGGIAQVLAHTIGPRTSASNGDIEALALPAAMKYVSAAGNSGYEHVARALGVQVEGARSGQRISTDAVRGLLRSIAGERTLRDFGIAMNDLRSIADSVGEDWFFSTLARGLARDELDALLVEIW